MNLISAGFYNGVKLIVSVHATEEAWRWPKKKRSRRLVKKMTKKYGPQIYRKPCMYMTPFGLVMHPDIYRQMKNKMEASSTSWPVTPSA